MKFTLKLLLVVLLICPTTAFAELPENVLADFAVVDGYVVAPINDEYVIDLDARNSLQVGDILTVVNPGKKLLHPVTKEVIGTVVEPIGFLQVTRVLSGYSYATPLTEGLKPAAGAQVKRFEQVPAVLTGDPTGSSELARQLKANLPQLHWLEGSESNRALLTFTLGNHALEVRNAQGDSLHKYKVADDQLVGTTATALRPATSPPAGPQPNVLQRLANTVTGVLEPNNDDRFAEMDAAIIRQDQAGRQGIWMGPNLDGHPIGLVVGDFDGDKMQETAVVLDHTLVIARISGGEYQQVAEVAIPLNLQVLSVDTLDLDDNGRDELYLSAMYQDRPASFVVEYTGAGYEIVIDWIGWLLRAIDFPAPQGRILVGQQTDNSEQVYLSAFFQMHREGSEVVKGESIALPAKLNIFNFVPFLDNSNLHNYAYLTAGDYLKVINAQGTELWSSPDYFGGSETCFTNRTEGRTYILVPTCVERRLIRMPDNSILAAQNIGQRIMNRYQKFLKSQAVAMGWNGLSLAESWRTASQSGYLGDFALADADNDGQVELVMVVKYKHKGLIDKDRSAIVIYELQ